MNHGGHVRATQARVPVFVTVFPTTDEALSSRVSIQVALHLIVPHHHLTAIVTKAGMELQGCLLTLPTGFNKQVSMLVFYAQSAGAVTSGRVSTQIYSRQNKDTT